MTLSGLDGTALIFFDFNTWIEAHEGHKDGDASSGLHGRDSDGGLIFLHYLLYQV